MTLLDLLQSGTGIGGLIGGIGGAVEKLLSTHMERKAKKDEYSHIETMFGLKSEADAARAAEQLDIDIYRGEYTGLKSSLEHDASFSFLDIGGLSVSHPRIAAVIYIMQAVANFIRVLFRPMLTVYCLKLAHTNPAYMTLASACVMWWIGSRGAASVMRRL